MGFLADFKRFVEAMSNALTRCILLHYFIRDALRWPLGDCLGAGFVWLEDTREYRSR